MSDETPETSEGTLSFLLIMNLADHSIAAFLTVEAQLKDIVQNLYNLIVQSYDHRGNQTQEAMKREVYDYYLENYLVVNDLKLTLFQPVTHSELGETISNSALDPRGHPSRHHKLRRKLQEP
jgi:hypothetical protein